GAVQRPDRADDGHPAARRQRRGAGRQGAGGSHRRAAEKGRAVVRLRFTPPEAHERIPMKATWNGAVIAESDDTVVVEGNHYFPESSLKREYVTFSNHRTSCPWKGQAHYYSLMVDGDVNPDAVWYYPEPSEAAREIKGRVAFWKGVKVE